MNDSLNYLINLIINGLVVGSVYSIISLSMVLIYKGSKVLNLAQGELLMLGGYVSLFFIAYLHLPFVIGLVLTMIAMGLMGLLIEKTVLRPMIGESHIAVIMVTLGLASVLKGIAGLLWGTNTYTLPKNFTAGGIMLGGISFSFTYLLIVGISLALLILFFFFFKYSIYGIALRATASDQTATMSMGISVKRMFALCWFISAALSAVVGVALTSMNGLNLTISSYALVALAPIILGGIDSIGGAILASFIVGVLESLSQGYLSSYVGGSVKEVTAFSVILIIMIFRPYGLFGTEEIERL